MASHDFVAHESPTSGNATARLEAAGIRSGLVLENIGRGYSAGEIHRGLLASPGHRANVVNPDVTHVGVGVVAAPEGSRNAYLVTELLASMRREVDLSGAPARVLDRINRSRRARGAPPLASDPNLAEAAANAARAYFEDPELSQQDVVDDASASLRRFAIAFRRLQGVMAVVTSIDEAGALEPTLEPGIRYAGVGVHQGSRPDVGDNAIVVVIMLAWPRS